MQPVNPPISGLTGTRPDGIIVQFAAFRSLLNDRGQSSSLVTRGIPTQIIDPNDYCSLPQAPLGLWLVVRSFGYHPARDDASAGGVSDAFVPAWSRIARTATIRTPSLTTTVLVTSRRHPA